MKKKHFFFLFSGLFVWSAHTDLTEDSAYEKKLHNIYLKHYKDPVPNSEWNNRLQSLPAKYQLKYKDNLWDLSGSFFQNSLYWSKMWVANPQVENPHLIYKGNFIKFDPLALAKVNTSKHSVDIQDQFPGLVVPQNKFSKDALMESEIPPSLPKLLSFRTIDDEIDVSQIHSAEVEKETIVPFYFTGTTPSIAGEVISKDGYGRTIGVGGENLVVRIEKSVSIGSIFTVFENRGSITQWYQFLTGLTEDEVMIKGRIKILSYLQGSDSLYTATVVESLHGISPGDLIFKGEPPVYNFSQKGTIGRGSGFIVGTPNKNQTLLSLNSIVYLDKGVNDGVHKGSLFYIRGNTEHSKSFKRPYTYDQPLLGKLKIIHSAENTATGIIIESRSQIYVGDIFSQESDRMEDLDKSQYHERIEDYEELEQGRDLLIDVEEVTEDEEVEDIEMEDDFEEEEEDRELIENFEDEDAEMEDDFEEEEEDRELIENFEDEDAEMEDDFEEEEEDRELIENFEDEDAEMEDDFEEEEEDRELIENFEDEDAEMEDDFEEEEEDRELIENFEDEDAEMEDDFEEGYEDSEEQEPTELEELEKLDTQ